MTLLLEATLRSSAVVLAGLLLCRALRHRSAALRHRVLAAALFAAGAVVPLGAILPAWDVPWPVPHSEPPEAAQVSAAVGTVTIVSDPARPARGTLWTVQLVWAGGAALCAFALAAGWRRVARVAARARPVRDGPWTQAADQLRAALGVGRPVALLQTDTPHLLATFGSFRPRILLPAHAADWSAERIRVVLWHELSHIRRHDWSVQMAAEILRSVYWFNPLLWIACTRLRREAEQACDDAVLGAGVAPREYAGHLLELARSCRRLHPGLSSAAQMARPSTLERRIAAMLNPHVDRARVSRRATALTVLLLAALTLAAAAPRAAQTAPLPLAGVVYDPTGAVLPGVQLTLEDAQEVTWSATTDASGAFAFGSVPPGPYVLDASLPGFRTLRHELQLRQARDWDRVMTLQVGEVRETIAVSASRLTGTAAAPASQDAQARIGGNVRPPRKLQHVRPEYPASMRAAGREGAVPLEAIIAGDGSVTSVRVLSAHVHPDFAIAAADAVRQWRFDPTLLNGVPVEVKMAVSVTFSLSD